MLTTCSLSFIGLLVYAIVIFHKQRKGTLGAYEPAGETHNLVQNYTSYNPQTEHIQPVPKPANNYYDPHHA